MRSLTKVIEEFKFLTGNFHIEHVSLGKSSYSTDHSAKMRGMRLFLLRFTPLNVIILCPSLLRESKSNCQDIFDMLTFIGL